MMKFDISEIGAIQCQLNFDEDYYLDYLQENGLQDVVRLESSMFSFHNLTIYL